MVTTCQVGPVALVATYRDGFCVDEEDCIYSKIKEAQGYTTTEEIPLMATAASTKLLGFIGTAVPKGC